MIVLVLILSTGCEWTTSPVSQTATPLISEAEVATLSALATQINAASAINTLQANATSTNTPEVQVGETPTNTPFPGSIVITGVVEKSQNTALVTWDVTGDFPSGFKIVWTDQQGIPTFPESNSISALSPTARSAIINVTPGTVYYLRVCRFLYDTCDIYSDLNIFAFLPPTATIDLDPLRTATAAAMKKTATAAAAASSGSSTSTGTAIATDSNLYITLIKDGVDGKAYMSWTDKVGSSLGYRIVYSKTASTPTYGSAYTYSINDSKIRSAYIYGDSNTKYYYRICRRTTTGCSAYSATYTFTYPTFSTTATSTITATPSKTPTPTITVTPSPTTDTSTITITGYKKNSEDEKIDLTWTTSGTFTDGFKLLCSTNSTPDLTNSTTMLIDGSLRTGTVTCGPGALYYLRICKITGSTCAVYSSTIVEYSKGASGMNLSPDASDPNKKTVLWDTLTNDDGYVIFWAEGTQVPVWSLAMTNQQTATRDELSSVISSLTANHSYMVRMCLWNATTSLCGDYSNTIFTTAKAP